MPGVRLVLALHIHQPVGNFSNVFEAAYQSSYGPFLELMSHYPEIPYVLHISGPLLEWLVENQPDYVAKLREQVQSGRVELLGGPFQEPILTMIPHRDRVGQIRAYTDYLHDLFERPVKGMWLPERVWEPHLVPALAEAGIDYLILDDYHFGRSGLDNRDDLNGYYLTEDDGRLLKVFPSSETLRYLIPFQEPHATYEHLREISKRQPGATVLFADDGEKFGSWPDTHRHVYEEGWLYRFCDMIQGNRDWLEPTTLARVVDETLPRGKVYLPEGSYREMTEWVLPARQQVEFNRALRQSESVEEPSRLRRFVRAGGYWRNFKAKYPECDEMYARMLGISERLAALETEPEADPDYLESARTDLYKGQCNCPYWHGSFGGLYLPHLRNAIYRHLIAAHNALDLADPKIGPASPQSRLSIETSDYNLDARQEACLANAHLVAFIRPACGGHLYELDDRRSQTNLLATLDRRPEPYHEAIAQASGLERPQSQDLSSLGGEDRFDPSRVVMKQDGLDQLLVYDRHPRKSLVDHILASSTTLDDLRRCRDVERGDFVQGAYLSKVQSEDSLVRLIMERSGLADGHVIHIQKSIELSANQSALEIRYVLSELPVDVPLLFGIEFNIAAMAGHAEDRYLSRSHDGERLGPLDTPLDLQADSCSGLNLTDEWLDLHLALTWDVPSGLWAFPIQTVSQSEGGYEGVYQSTALLPYWTVQADSTRQWQLAIRWSLDPASIPDDAPSTTLGEAPLASNPLRTESDASADPGPNRTKLAPQPKAPSNVGP